jgi:transposase InsO family protein
MGSALRKVKAKLLEMPPMTAAPARVDATGQMALSLVVTPQGPNLSPTDRVEAERRYGVIEPLLPAARDNYHLLHVQFPAKADLVAYLSKTHKTPRATMYRWLASYKKGGLAALVRKDRADKGAAKALNNAALEFLLAASLPQRGKYGVWTVNEIYRAYEEERVWRAANAGKKMGAFEQSKYARYIDEDGRLRETALLPQASQRTFARWYGRIPEVARVMAREGEEAFRNTQEVISFRELTAIAPLDYVVMDHRRLDIFCLAPKKGGGWNLVRPWLTAAIDMRTRKWLGWAIVESPSSDSIAASLKRAIIDWGVPKACYWDNGKDFTCEWMEGNATRTRQAEKTGELDTTWRGVMGTLGIRVHHAIVRNARAKIIEPNFVRIANFDRSLPEWCGHNPGARPDHYAELVAEHEAWERGEREQTPFRTIAEVADLYTRAIEDLNERPLEGDGMRKATPTGMGWMCPNEAWEVLTERVDLKTIEPALLHMCFAKRREYTVQHGEIKVTRAGKAYHYRVANNGNALMALNGMTVELAYDPMDMGEAAVYYQSRFVAMVNNVELRRMGETAFVDDERARRTARREVKRFIQAVHDAVPVATPDERLDRRREVLPAERGKAVPRVELPVELPAAVVEAEAAARADREFRFDGVNPAQVALASTAPAVDEDDGEFHFFGAK